METIDVGKRIKSIRKRKNLTLQEVSEKSGMSATAISGIERNVSSPTVTTLVAIAPAQEADTVSLVVDEVLSGGRPGLEDSQLRVEPLSGHSVREALEIDVRDVRGQTFPV